jgi:osomolarity two-component system, sensor histidine kinase NIK1
MSSSLTDQVRSIALVTTAVARGDLTRKIEIQVEGELATLKTTVNSMVDNLRAFVSEVNRIAFVVDTHDIFCGAVRVESFQGIWADVTLNLTASLFFTLAINVSTEWYDVFTRRKWQVIGRIRCA